MNVRLAKDYSLLASVYWKGDIINNYYSISLGMITNTEHNSEQNIAFSRIGSFIGDFIHSGVFIKQDEHEQIYQLQNAGIKTMTIPEAPFDQSVAIALFCKLNAICENKLLITDITVTSSLSDNVKYLFDSEDAFGPFDEDGWWNETTPIWFEQDIEQDVDDKVVQFKPNLTWEDINLGWEEPVIEDNNVVKGNFIKADD